MRFAHEVRIIQLIVKADFDDRGVELIVDVSVIEFAVVEMRIFVEEVRTAVVPVRISTSC
jgi:hypothetical protein